MGPQFLWISWILIYLTHELTSPRKYETQSLFIIHRNYIQMNFEKINNQQKLAIHEENWPNEFTWHVNLHVSFAHKDSFVFMDISIYQPTQLIFHLHLDWVHVGFGCIQPVDSFPRSHNFFGQDFTGLFFPLFGSIFKWSLYFLFFSLNPYKIAFKIYTILQKLNRGVIFNTLTLIINKHVPKKQTWLSPL